MINKLDDLLKVSSKRMKLVVVACHDKEVLEAVVQSSKYGITEPILIGDKAITYEIAESMGISLDSYRFIDESDLSIASEIGVKMVSQGEADFIMKGLVDTSILLKAVLNKEWGLRTESQLSHVMVYEVPTYHKLIFLTDGGMNLMPNIEEKEKIIKNACIITKAFGYTSTRVALLAAKEKLDSKMIATVDAGELKERYNRGKYAKDIIIEGPMALDLAISKDAARIKGYNSEVAGNVDILLVPNIEMGNGIGKAITYLAGGKSAGIIMGAKVPIVLVSRADDNLTKLYSIGLGSIVASRI